MSRSCEMGFLCELAKHTFKTFNLFTHAPIQTNTSLLTDIHVLRNSGLEYPHVKSTYCQIRLLYQGKWCIVQWSLLIVRPIDSHSSHSCLGHHPCEVLIPYAPWSRCQRRQEGGNVGRGPLIIQLGVCRSVVSSPSGVQGRAPAEDGLYAHLRSERSHLEHLFQYIWVMSRGQEKLSLVFPSWRACS